MVIIEIESWEEVVEEEEVRIDLDENVLPLDEVAVQSIVVVVVDEESSGGVVPVVVDLLRGEEVEMEEEDGVLVPLTQMNHFHHPTITITTLIIRIPNNHIQNDP
jgi:hypothetical protein